MSDPVHLTEPAKVVLVRPGGVRVPVSFDTGDHDPDQGTDEREALDRIVAMLARRDDAVPDSVDAVKAWVGDDPDRARVALDTEAARAGGPRKTLVPWLEGLAGPDDDDTADAHQEGDHR